MTLGKNLKILMKKKKIPSIRALSAMCNIAPSSLHHIVNGRHPRDLTSIARLAQCLEVSMFYLLFGYEDPHHHQVTENLYKEFLSGKFEVEMKLKKRI